MPAQLCFLKGKNEVQQAKTSIEINLCLFLKEFQSLLSASLRVVLTKTNTNLQQVTEIMLGDFFLYYTFKQVSEEPLKVTTQYYFLMIKFLYQLRAHFEIKT